MNYFQQEIKFYLPQLAKELNYQLNFLNKAKVFSQLNESFIDEIFFLGSKSTYLQYINVYLKEIKLKVIYQQKALHLDFFQKDYGIYILDVTLNDLADTRLKKERQSLPTPYNLMHLPQDIVWTAKPFSVLSASQKKILPIISFTDIYSDEINLKDDLPLRMLKELLSVFTSRLSYVRTIDELKFLIEKDFSSSKEEKGKSSYEEALEDF